MEQRGESPVALEDGDRAQIIGQAALLPMTKIRVLQAPCSSPLRQPSLYCPVEIGVWDLAQVLRLLSTAVTMS